MTREEAHDYMWNKNEECPSMRWQNHATIRDYVSLMIDDIYDSLEQRIAELETHKTCEGCIHFTPSSTQHFELCTYDFDCSDDYKPPSRFEPKERSNDNPRRL